MFILGHVGFALGATQIGEAAIRKASGGRLGNGARLVDYRLLAIGALLPDLVDKPLAFFILPELGEMTRSGGHTLLFALVLLVFARLWSGRERLWLVPLALGCMFHLLLDGMWSMPQTLFWPVFGWEYPTSQHTNLFTGLPLPFDIPWHSHWGSVTEAMGGLMIGYVLLGVWRERRARGSVAAPALPLSTLPAAKRL